VLFTESYLSDIDNIVPLLLNQNKKDKIKEFQSRLIRLIGVVFSNSTRLLVSDTFDSVNERTQEIGELMKLHIQEVWQNSHKFVRQLAHTWHSHKTGFSDYLM